MILGGWTSAERAVDPEPSMGRSAKTITAAINPSAESLLIRCRFRWRWATQHATDRHYSRNYRLPSYCFRPLTIHKLFSRPVRKAVLRTSLDLSHCVTLIHPRRIVIGSKHRVRIRWNSFRFDATLVVRCCLGTYNPAGVGLDPRCCRIRCMEIFNRRPRMAGFRSWAKVNDRDVPDDFLLAERFLHFAQT